MKMLQNEFCRSIIKNSNASHQFHIPFRKTSLKYQPLWWMRGLSFYEPCDSSHPARPNIILYEKFPIILSKCLCFKLVKKPKWKSMSMEKERIYRQLQCLWFPWLRTCRKGFKLNKLYTILSWLSPFECRALIISIGF